MRNLMIYLAIAGLIISGCSNSAEAPTKNIGDICIESNECILPKEFAVQSNCPFKSACIQGKCAAVCPIFYNDPNPQIKKSYEFRCTIDKGCDCSNRGNKTLACGCIDGICSSVEGWVQ